MNSVTKGIDQEWLELMVEAKRLGLSIQEIRQFIANALLQNAKEDELESI